MKQLTRWLAAASIATGLSFAAQAADDMTAKVQQKLRTTLGPGISVKNSAPMANGQIIEVMLQDGSVVHMTPDLGNIIYNGEVLQLSKGGVVNLTKKRMDPIRAGLMKDIADKETVVFKAKGEEKATINVFTDIDCGYCRKLHNEVPELNELGITVRYLAYPRAGMLDQRTGGLTGSYKKIKSVWCDKDRPAAMTLAKKNRNIKDNLDCEAPINDHLELGREVGVRGTPAIVVDDGRFIGGYVPAAELAKMVTTK